MKVIPNKTSHNAGGKGDPFRLFTGPLKQKARWEGKTNVIVRHARVIRPVALRVSLGGKNEGRGWMGKFRIGIQKKGGPLGGGGSLTDGD